MPISCHFQDCKALLVTSLTHISGTITSVQAFTFTNHCIAIWWSIALHQVLPVHGCHELDECCKCFHACIYAKEVHFGIYCDSRVHTCTIKFIWLILSTIRLSGDIVLDTLEFCYFLILCFSQDSVAIHCRYGRKYDTDLVANLLLSITVQ